MVVFRGVRMYVIYLSCKVPLAMLFHLRLLEQYLARTPHARFETLVSSFGRQKFFLHTPVTYVTEAILLL